MADENKDLQTEDTSATADTQPTAPAADQQSLDLGAPAEVNADPKPEAATGETSPAGTADLEATEPAPAADEPAPTMTDHAAVEAPGGSDAPTPDVAASSDVPADTSAPAGADEAAPVAPSTPDQTPAADPVAADPTASDAAAPAEAAPAQAQDTSTSTGIGGDKAAEVAPEQAPNVDAAPVPTPAPSSPGLFDHGTPINLPDLSVPSDEGYPIAQPGQAPAHPQHFGELVGDGVGDDAGKVAGDTKYPAPAGVVTNVGKQANGAGEAAKPAEDELDNDGMVSTDIGLPDTEPQAEDPAPAPHVEHKLSKLMKKVIGLEEKIERLLKEFLG